jgi:hypothetical protein
MTSASDTLDDRLPAWWAVGWISCVAVGSIDLALETTADAWRAELLEQFDGDRDRLWRHLRALLPPVVDGDWETHTHMGDDGSATVVILEPVSAPVVLANRAGLGIELVAVGHDEWHVSNVVPDWVPPDGITVQLPPESEN